MIYDTDPYLMPFKAAIDVRHERILATRDLIAVDGSLSAGVNNHLFYGLHREPDGGWIFREWAPNASRIWLVGEFNNYLNIGVGYTIPFGTFAAEWLDAEALKAKLDSYDIPGTSFRTIYFKPFSGGLAGKLIQGGGGGQPHYATAGGKNKDGLSAAVDKVIAIANL